MPVPYKTYCRELALPAAATKKFLATKLHEGTRRKKIVVQRRKEEDRKL
jgi:hypothetical protein